MLPEKTTPETNALENIPVSSPGQKSEQSEFGPKKTLEKIAERIADFPAQKSSEESIIQKIQAKLGQGGLAGSVRTREEEVRHTMEVEKTMSKNLEEFYAKMPPGTKQEFKIKGEETARKINLLLHQTKVKIKKIIKLLRNWLKIIPGANKYFLEQSSKIKADELVKLKEGW